MVQANVCVTGPVLDLEENQLWEGNLEERDREKGTASLAICFFSTPNWHRGGGL